MQHLRANVRGLNSFPVPLSDLAGHVDRTWVRFEGPVADLAGKHIGHAKKLIGTPKTFMSRSPFEGPQDVGSALRRMRLGHSLASGHRTREWARK